MYQMKHREDLEDVTISPTYAFIEDYIMRHNPSKIGNCIQKQLEDMFLPSKSSMKRCFCSRTALYLIASSARRSASF